MSSNHYDEIIIKIICECEKHRIRKGEISNEKLLNKIKRFLRINYVQLELKFSCWKMLLTGPSLFRDKTLQRKINSTIWSKILKISGLEYFKSVNETAKHFAYAISIILELL